MSANRHETDKPKRKAPRTAFKAGQSGNPSGRPPKTPEELDLIAACRSKTTDALGVMVNMMHNGEQERNRLTAALAIIERAHGKPVQPTDTHLTGAVTFGWLE
jgi:Family of unknown function (DUF5681)